MRLALSLVVFIFLSAAAAGVVPIAGRDLAVSYGGEGIHNASMSSFHPHPSGFPTNAPFQSGTPVSCMGPDPTPTRSLHWTMSGAPDPHLSAPCAASDYPTQSAPSNNSHPPALRRAQPTDGHSPFPASHTPSANGTYARPSVQPTMDMQPYPSGFNPSGVPDPSTQPTDGHSPYPAPHTANVSDTRPHLPSQPTFAMQPHRSDFPSGASDYPMPSVTPSDGSVHMSGPPSWMSTQPEPMMSPA